MLDERVNPPEAVADLGRPPVPPAHAVEIEAAPDRRAEGPTTTDMMNAFRSEWARRKKLTDAECAIEDVIGAEGAGTLQRDVTSGGK